MATFGGTGADVLDQRLLGLGADAEVFSVRALDLDRAINSLGALSKQSPSRLMETVIPRDWRTLR